MLRWMLLGVLGLLPRAAADSQVALVPLPESVTPGRGSFAITPETPIVAQDGVAEARWAAEQLEAVLAGALRRRAPQSSGPRISIAIGGAASLAPEGYELSVTTKEVRLQAPEPLGLLRGIQTLRQLLPPACERAQQDMATIEVPAVEISDRPRYRWRGMLLDCCRHFMDVAFVKRYIDLLAYHRMNVLHWHLTEDQGWRLQIDRYPRLTEVGAWRGPDRYGGYYTKEQVREVLAYAKQRGITVVPEIELPGHASAALASYPNLGCTGGPYEVQTKWGVFPEVYCAGNEDTFAFLEGVLTEVIELFPSEYIHIGGDECPKSSWKECPKCQARIKAEGLKDEHELQSYFVRRIERFLNSKGRRLIGWDEILEGGLAPNATVQSWRGMSGAISAAKAGHDVISSPTSHCYLDYAQRKAPGEPTFMGFIDLPTAYRFEPTPSELNAAEEKHVLGLEGNMWTEHAPQERVDYQVFPRLCALAEVGWSPRDRRDWGDFSERLETHLARLAARGVTYYQPAPTVSTPDRVFAESLTVELAGAPGGGRIVYTLDGSDPVATSTVYTQPLTMTESTVLKVVGVGPGGNVTPTDTYKFIREEPHAAVAPASKAGLRYAVHRGSMHELPPDGIPPADYPQQGVSPDCDLSQVTVDVNYLLLLRGRIEVPQTGLYRFHLTSDDGSRLRIAGREVIDNDGLHGAVTRSGQIMLMSGAHEFAVDFFQAGGAQRLRLEWEGPGVERRVVPATAFSHEE